VFHRAKLKALGEIPKVFLCCAARIAQLQEPEAALTGCVNVSKRATGIVACPHCGREVEAELCFTRWGAVVPFSMIDIDEAPDDLPL
jgi:hypothetical protein